jgi:hypothetical protein
VGSTKLADHLPSLADGFIAQLEVMTRLAIARQHMAQIDCQRFGVEKAHLMMADFISRNAADNDRLRGSRKALFSIMIGYDGLGGI